MTTEPVVPPTPKRCPTCTKRAKELFQSDTAYERAHCPDPWHDVSGVVPSPTKPEPQEWMLAAADEISRIKAGPETGKCLDDAHRDEVRRPAEIIAKHYAEAVAPSQIELRSALIESVKLQSHYAMLLNMYDQGERKQFATAEEWIERLRKVGKLRGEEKEIKKDVAVS